VGGFRASAEVVEEEGVLVGAEGVALGRPPNIVTGPLATHCRSAPCARPSEHIVGRAQGALLVRLFCWGLTMRVSGEAARS